MKNLLAFFLILGITLASCDKDDDDNILYLNLDSNNANAPELPASDYVTAARFTTSELNSRGVIDSTLTAVRFYLQGVPNELKVVIYEGSASVPNQAIPAPVNLIYESNVLSAVVESDSWNTHDLPNDIAITGEDLWIGVSFRHTAPLRSIGCDPGPEVENGALIRDPNLNGGAWTTFSAFSNERINWNIRGIVGDY